MHVLCKVPKNMLIAKLFIKLRQVQSVYTTSLHADTL